MLERDRSLVPRLAGTLLLGVTEFFRDNQVFSAIESHVLPAILLRTRTPAIWSAACSDGHELYSVAMLLSRLHSLEQAFLLGTDCRRESIATAVAGIYPIAAAASIPALLRRTWIVEQKEKFQITPKYRDRLSWRVSDLLSERELGRWHLILWRNMAIYLTQAAANRVWEGILLSLEPGGFVVTGKAERPPAHLNLVRLDRCIYQKPA
jgi:chemotaxis methyl-accepting protein methylase